MDVCRGMQWRLKFFPRTRDQSRPSRLSPSNRPSRRRATPRLATRRSVIRPPFRIEQGSRSQIAHVDGLHSSFTRACNRAVADEAASRRAHCAGEKRVKGTKVSRIPHCGERAQLKAAVLSLFFPVSCIHRKPLGHFYLLLLHHLLFSGAWHTAELDR